MQVCPGRFVRCWRTRRSACTSRATTERRSACLTHRAGSSPSSGTGARSRSSERACLRDQDLQTLRSKQGLWWSPVMLDDSDLDPCRGERLNSIIERARGQVAPPSCLVDDAGPGARVLLALHGGGECVTDHDNPWAAAASVGWTVCRPVSSQRRGAGLATWTNLDEAVEECRTHLDRIGRIDAIGSFSLGGSLALRLITEVVDVPVVMVAPSLLESVVANVARGASTARVTSSRGSMTPSSNRHELVSGSSRMRVPMFSSRSCLVLRTSSRQTSISA
jgi:hypothetical protein